MESISTDTIVFSLPETAGPSADVAVADKSNRPDLEKLLHEMEWELNVASAFLELLVQAENSDNLDEASAKIVNELQKFLGADRVCLGICGSRPDHFSHLAVSGMTKIDRQSEKIRSLEAVLAEAVARGQVTSWSDSGVADGQGTLAHQQWFDNSSSEYMLTSPLRGSDESPSVRGC